MSDYLHTLHQEHVERRQRLFPVVSAHIKARQVLAAIAKAQTAPPEVPKLTKRVFSSAYKKNITSHIVEIAAHDAPPVTIPVMVCAKGQISMARVIAVVAQFYRISRADLVGPARQTEIVMPRHIAAYLCREYLRESYPRIARRLGRKDHTSTIYAYRKIKHQIAINAAFADDLPEIKARIGL